MPEPASVLVVGLGNILLGDDALGPTALHALAARYEVDARVRLLDLGTPGSDLLPQLAGAVAVIVLDTVRAAGAPGELRLYRKPALLAQAPPARVSPHDPGLAEALLGLEFRGEAPEEVLLVGVIPGGVTTGLGLSAAVEAAVPRVIEAVTAELVRLGCPARRRDVPLEGRPWWAPGAT